MASQTITSPDTLQFTQDNKHVYAYSGTVDVGDVQNQYYSILEFDTGSGYIRAKVQFHYSAGNSNDFKYSILFNDEKVAEFHVTHGQYPFYNPIWVVIPPFTTVKCQGANTEAAAARSQLVSITGSVYDTLPVRN